MKQSEVTEIVALLFASYPQSRAEESTLRVFERQLVALDKGKLEDAVMRLTRTHKFPPSIAEIFEVYSVVENGRPLDVGEAYESVTRAIRYVGAYRPLPTEGRYALPERVKRTVEALGGWEMVCLHDHEESFRARFFEVYGSLSKIDGDDRKARSVALPEGVTDLQAARQLGEKP